MCRKSWNNRCPNEVTETTLNSSIFCMHCFVYETTINRYDQFYSCSAKFHIFLYSLDCLQTNHRRTVISRILASLPQYSMFNQSRRTLFCIKIHGLGNLEGFQKKNIYIYWQGHKSLQINYKTCKKKCPECQCSSQVESRTFTHHCSRKRTRSQYFCIVTFLLMTRLCNFETSYL